MERLAALGYVEAPRARAPGTELDPRRLVAFHGWVDQARGAANAGDYERSIESLETLAQSPSVRTFVLRSLAPIYAENGRFDDAIAAYRDYIELTGADEARLGLARVFIAARRPAEALAELNALSGRSTSVETVRARALARLGRHAEARAVVDAAFAAPAATTARLYQRAALVVDVAPLADGETELRALAAAAPNDAALKSWLGYYLAVWGRPEQREESATLLRGAAAAEPRDAQIQANLGWGSYKLGRDQEAVTALEAALALDDERSLERLRLAVVLHRLGEHARALALARAALASRPAARWTAEGRALAAELERASSERPRAEARPPTRPPAGS
jgi:tetratricopeptide (TPR) repeat protein